MAKLIELADGFRLCYEKKEGSLACAFGVFVNVGSRNEGKKENGIAHFIEHMVFKGTEKRTAFDIADETDMMGADSNAYTSKFHTVFYFKGLNKFAERFVELLGDMVFCSTFTEENIEKERGVILEEIKMYDDDGESLCYDLMAKTSFVNGSPLSRPVLGTRKSVSALKREDLVAFHDKWYRPENMVLSFSGDVDEETIVGYVEKYMSANVKKTGKKFVPFVEKKSEILPGCATLRKPFEQSTVLIRFPLKRYGEEKKYVGAHLGNMLGGGMSSRLFRVIREEMGLAYEIYATTSTRTDGGNLDIFFGTSPANVGKAVAAVRDVLKDVAKNGFSADEMTKSRVQFETSVALGAESAFDRMRQMGKKMICFNELIDDEKDIEDLNAVTGEDVALTAAEIFAEQPVICCVGKKPDCDLAAVYKEERI